MQKGKKSLQISTLILKDEYYAKQSICFVEDTFGKSKLSKHQAEELKKSIDEHKEV